LLQHGAQLEARDLAAQPLSAEELDALIGKRDYRQFLNTRNEIYRQKKMAEHPPSREEAIRLMAREPNLIRRPVVIAGGTLVLGYDEPALRALIAGRKPAAKKKVR
jgi:arsenate reductase-like glutaredoxin family protein